MKRTLSLKQIINDQPTVHGLPLSTYLAFAGLDAIDEILLCGITFKRVSSTSACGVYTGFHRDCGMVEMTVTKLGTITLRFIS